ncbi:hypothetical protein PLICRDRAFT_44469 [Plicaturopsis crispa FD-325 SS-3]|nr:hypothetical protein PLICRDRAFT_44469 [Plicaturopsis crispa FD-325 SS-3]
MAALPVYLLALIVPVIAHKHHAELTEEQTNAPVDATLWIHIFIQALAWGVIFPIGMVLGMTRSRWHVPMQSAGIALTAAGYILGHAHKGRQFLASAHGPTANVLFFPLLAQLVVGVYLKLHIHERTLRPWAVRVHGFIGKAFPVFGWTQMMFGVIAYRGYCRPGLGLGQCAAHYIMGSGFIAYGAIMTILRVLAEGWVRRSGRSPEWWDSWVIMAWGVVNTFTEHRGSHWSVKDMEHTILGILWWAGGIMGIWLSRKNQRSVVPGLIILITGWAMTQHAQALMLSTKVHSMFGNTLMAAGFSHIIEVCFVAPKHSADPEEHNRSMDGDSDHTLADASLTGNNADSARGWRTYRYLPPFLLVASGLLFISATDEELRFASDNGMDHVTYILIMYSIAFLLYAYMLMLMHLYAIGTARRESNGVDVEIEMTGGPRNKWYARVPGVEGVQLPDTPRDEFSNTPLHVLGDDED